MAADQKLMKELEPSLAVAEIVVKPDAGDQPYAAGWGSRCPSCGRYHETDMKSYVDEERPLEVPAFFMSADTVIIPDPMIHSRFVKSIQVRRPGGEAVTATVEKIAVQHRALLLKLEKPIAGVKPLAFASGDLSGLKTLIWTETNGRWNVTLKGFGTEVTSDESGAAINSVTKDALLVTADGKVRGAVFSESLPVDLKKWVGSPVSWQWRTVQEEAALYDRLRKSIGEGVVRVHIGLRNPPAKPDGGMRFGRDNNEDSTERDVHGVVVGENRVLVLHTMKPDVTARLERLTVHTSDGKTFQAKFVASIRDYGIVVAETTEKLPTVLKMSPLEPTAAIGPAMTLAEVQIAGETRTDYLSRTRLGGLSLGWRKNLYPSMAIASDKQDESFVFDDAGNLIALPVAQRPKPQKNNEYMSWRQDSAKLTFARQLADIIANPQSHADTNNVPLTEEQQNRQAWLGVELQDLTADLARLNKVSQLTNDGSTGALVTYVYPGSPAEKAGITVGTVLLRIQDPDQPAPVDISADDYMFAEREFPWAQYDNFPEAFFDRMPAPWPSTAKSLSKMLTEIGFGKTVTLEFAQDGAAKTKQFEIVESPRYYDSATRLKNERTGLTVRELTYEVRRYFQLAPDAPGVIVSNIEQGSSASKAGIKPYELVISVNGTPITKPADFEEATKGTEELRLDVQRMNKLRVVKVK